MEWLLAEEDDGWGWDEYDGSGDNEDNSAMSECDNFIVKSSVSFSKTTKVSMNLSLLVC